MFAVGCTTAQRSNAWTILHYAVGANSSEVDLLSDIQEMMDGKLAAGYEVIVLIDRTPGFSEDSTTLGENFTDTRLFRITHQGYERLAGGDELPQLSVNSTVDLDMADAQVLKQFVRFGKRHYPAEHYMLVLRSHGNGVGMCPDHESGAEDRLFPGEISDVLTADESVDILGLDVCSMAGLENLYEWRPGNGSFSADLVIASAPLSGAWAYDRILGRLKDGGTGRDLDPARMTPMQFATMIFEEIKASQTWASWGLFDNSRIATVKAEVDALARSLVQEDHATIPPIIDSTLGYYHNTGPDTEVSQLTFPYVDAYHFYTLLSGHEGLRPATRAQAAAVCAAIDELVVASYYGTGFLPATNDFTDGKGGVYQILPMGQKVFSRTGSTFWAHSTWFHPDAIIGEPASYGAYDWCSDGAVKGNGEVENFFEYLDALFDDPKAANGGVNHYRW
ncbi:MAG: clostripain-related cysteine peptidase [Flavobacteriales bacterium]